jgi:hypothetical protein
MARQHDVLSHALEPMTGIRASVGLAASLSIAHVASWRFVGVVVGFQVINPLDAKPAPMMAHLGILLPLDGQSKSQPAFFRPAFSPKLYRHRQNALCAPS